MKKVYAEKRIKKKSLILTHPFEQIFKTIPPNLSQNIQELVLPNNQIQSLQGIEKYKFLQYIDISNNKIASVLQLAKLSKNEKLRKIKINGNQFCSKINYLYNVINLLFRLEQVNDFQLSPLKRKNIKLWQRQNGTLMNKFLFNKLCLVYEIKSKGKEIKNVQKYQQTLSNLIQYSSQTQNILQLNQNLYQSLKSINSVNEYSKPTIDQEAEVQDFILNYFIEHASSNQECQHIIESLLSSIEIGTQKQQKLLQQEEHVETVEVLLSKQLKKQLQFCQFLQDQSHQEDLKHLISAQTAIDSNLSRKRLQKLRYPIYFALDLSYVKISYQLMIEELQKIVNISKQQPSKNSISQREEGFIMTFNPTQQSLDTYFDHSPKKMYQNSIILANIIDCFEHSLKKIIFRKIFQHKPIEVYTEIFQNLFNTLQPYEQKRKQEIFYKIKEYSEQIECIFKFLEMKKLKRMFRRWKNLKKKKQKLLTKILKKKIKVDKFLVSVALMRWKVESRAAKIQRMTSQVTLKINTRAYSKKGLDIAYKRVMSKRKLK